MTGKRWNFRGLRVVILASALCCGSPTEPERYQHAQELESVGSVAAPTTAPIVVPAAGPRIPVLDCTTLEEVGYRNGRRFPISVLSIDGRLVETETARAYWAMQEAAAADGIELPIYSGFRSNEHQAYFYRCYKTCSCNSCTPAARPGHSKHQSGSAIDFGQWPGVIDWLERHGRKFRFYPTVRREPWHWEYRPRRNKRKRKKWDPICEAH